MTKMMLNQKRLDYVDMRLASLPFGYVNLALEIGREGGPDVVSGSLLIALSIRETGLRAVLGDKGRARGPHQFHDAYHAPFLRSVIGTRNARTIPEHEPSNWLPVRGSNALQAGFGPTWEDSCRYAARIINALYEQAEADGVPEEDCLEVAVAAYNVGYTRALAGYFEPRRRWTAAMRSALHPGEPTGLRADKYTTRGNYAADVLLRRSEVNRLLRT